MNSELGLIYVFVVCWLIAVRNFVGGFVLEFVRGFVAYKTGSIGCLVKIRFSLINFNIFR